MRDLLKDRLRFSYENDAASSFIIVTIGQGEKIIEHQVEMICSNPVTSILPVSVRLKDNERSLYYTITSKQSLKQFLTRKKLKRNEVLDILIYITRTVVDCKNHFLYDKNFLLDEEFIYINPVTLETSLVYLPVQLDIEFTSNFKLFITNLLVNSAHVDESSSDNFMQRILNLAKTDTFNAAALDRLLSELRHGNSIAQDAGQKSQKNVTRTSKIHIPQQSDQYLQNNNIHVEEVKLQFNGRRHEEEVYKTRYKPNILLAAILSQVLLVIAVIVLYQTVLFKQESDPTSVMGLFLIVGAMDFLILKNLLDKKNMETVKVSEPLKSNAGVNKIKGQRYTEDHAVSTSRQDTYFQAAKQSEEYIAGEFFGAASAEAGPVLQTGGDRPPISADETVILGCSQDSYPYLRSAKSGNTGKIAITKPSFIIGRLEDQVDYILQNNTVGKLHAEIISKGGLYYLKDLNSRNGTYINGNKIKSNIEYKINDSDSITFADSEFTFYTK